MNLQNTIAKSAISTFLQKSGVFVKFLGLLRDNYLNREDMPTFYSVIIAGVYDVKNLKLRMRPDEQHQYNSPWNIEAPFEISLELDEPGIKKMLDYI